MRQKALQPHIPDHEISRCIGRGGYGEIWLARNVMGTFRAVKVIRRSTFSDRRPYEREFMGLRRFEPVSRTHPGLVSVLHTGRNDKSGYFYYIMELADDVASGQAIRQEEYEARTLGRELRQRGSFPLPECCKIGLSLTAALEHLHQQGLVHRDIKPSNIIYVNQSPKLADIGLVTDIGQDTTYVGTQGYIAPEGPGTPVSDLYSLGKVLYEMSTGKDREQFPDLPSTWSRPEATSRFQRFNEILLKACASQPRDRYQSAQDMHAALLQCYQGDQNTAPHDSHAPSAVQTAVESERKLLTVLFVNIAIAESADPEEVHEFMQKCFAIIRPAVQRFEGTITQLLSDGVMAVFGAPIACEDHATRGVHAALAVHRVLAEFSEHVKRERGRDFEVRSSLNTGLVVASQASSQLESSVMGETASLAARMLVMAEAGQVVIAQDTFKSVRDHFSITPLGERSLPGSARPTKLFQVNDIRRPRMFNEMAFQAPQTQFVGRSKEIAQLQQHFTEAERGRGQIVLVAGEPGVGKSRLLLEFRRSLGTSDAVWLVGRSISYGGQIAYLPIIDWIREFFQLAESEDEARTIERLERGVQELGAEVQSSLPYLRGLLSMDPGDDAVRRIDPNQRRIRTFDALRRWILKAAQHHPIVLIVEDLHWMDKISEEFLVWLTDSLTMARVLLLLSYRPDYRSPFPERSYVSRFVLRQLTGEESLELARNMLDEGEPPSDLDRLILEKTDGNPFFVEEVIKSLLETGALQRRKGHYDASKPLSAIRVPDNVQGVIMGRIDRSGSAPKRVLQLASVIGRQFDVDLLETIVDSRDSLSESLGRLKAIELIYEQGSLANQVCIFKHALTQEVAYNSLLIQRRKELHRLVAASIEELYAARLPEYYGLLAYHYERGEEWQFALDYLIRAAETSHHMAAYREEASLLSQAMNIAQRLDQPAVLADLRGRRGAAWSNVGLWAAARPDLETGLKDLPSDQLERRAELLLELSAVCFWGLDIPSMHRCAAEGNGIALKVGRSDLSAGFVGWLAAAQQANGDLQSAMDLYERALAVGGGFCFAPAANFPLTLYLRGRIAEALARAREAARMYRSLSDTQTRTFGLPHLGLALAAAGRYGEATRVFEEARRFGREYEVWPFHARAIAMSAGFHLDVFDLDGHERLSEEAREYARSAGFQPTIISANLDLVFNYARRGEISRAEALLRDTSDAIERTGGWHQWLWELRLEQARAEIAAALGHWEEALSLAQDSLARSRARGRVKYEVAGLRTRAAALAEMGREPEAVTELETAIRLSREVGDPAMFLQTSTAMLAFAENETLLSEAIAAARRILDELPTPEMRSCFEAAEPVSMLGPIGAGAAASPYEPQGDHKRLHTGK